MRDIWKSDFNRLQKIIHGIVLGTAIFFVWVAFGLNEASAAIIGKPPTNLGLVGYWSMNEGTGSYAGDASGNRNEGVLTNGPAWVDGKRGKALSFDGSNDYVSIKDGKINDSNQGTVTMWVKTGATLVDGATVLAYGGSDTAGLHFQEALVSGSYYWHIYHKATGGGTVGYIDWFPALTTNTWYFIAFVSDGSAYSFYANGVLQSKARASAGIEGEWFSDISPVSGGVSTIGNGKYNGSFINHFPGLIDDVRVYNRALSAAEIQALYKSGASRIGL